MRVDVSGKTLAFPRRCVCCGRPPDAQMFASATRTSGVRVVRHQTATWRFPACTTCTRHVDAWLFADSATTGCSIAGVCVAFIALVTLGGWAFLVASVFMTVGVFWLRQGLRTKARAQLFPDCACAWQAVAYLGWNGTRESFLFAQNGYGVEFMLANLRKVVSVSPDGQQVFETHVRRMQEEAAAAEQHLRREAEIAKDDAEFARAVAKMENAKGPAGRRGGLEAGLRALKQQHMRERLLIEASRIEVEAALEKAEGQKSPAAKLRTLRAALDAIRSDPVPDELQGQQIRWLEDAIAQIENEKNSIEEI